MEIGLIVSTVILLAQEIWQLRVALRADYIREAENFFEWSIVLLSLVCLFEREGEWLSTISSITVLLAWIQVIFILGRLPSYVGEFSLMFYAFAKRVLKISLGFFIAIFAFGLAFFILHFEFNKDNRDNSRGGHQTFQQRQVLGQGGSGAARVSSLSLRALWQGKGHKR